MSDQPTEPEKPPAKPPPKRRGGWRPGSGRKRKMVLPHVEAKAYQRGELAPLARKFTHVALRALLDVAANGKSEAARVSASAELFNRGFGRPPQDIQHAGAVGSWDLAKLSDADLAEMMRLQALLMGGTQRAPDGEPPALEDRRGDEPLQ